MTDRRVWLADSFHGLPKPEGPRDELELSRDTHPQLAVPRQRVEDFFKRFDLLDDQVEFLEGWFEDTLPSAPIEQIAVLRVDGDLYSSTIDALTALYDKVSPGGFVILDDYNLIDECRRAIDDFRAERGIREELVDVDWCAAYWRRATSSRANS